MEIELDGKCVIHKMFGKAKKFLYGEISKQFGMDIEDVEKFVCSAVKKSLDDF